MKRQSFELLARHTGEWKEYAQTLVFLHELSHPHWPSWPPAGYEWSAFAASPSDELGAMIDRALSILEEAHPEELGFGDLCFAGLPPEVLKASLVETERFCATADDRSTVAAREELLGILHMQTLSASRARATGAFYTPWAVALLKVKIAAIRPGQWILDPAAGAGVLMLAAIADLRERYGDHGVHATTFVCVELMADAARVCRLNLALAAVAMNSVVFCANGLAQDVAARHPDGRLMTVAFHICLSNPPFGGSKTSLAELQAIREAYGPLKLPKRLLNRPVLVPCEANLAGRSADDGPETESPAAQSVAPTRMERAAATRRHSTNEGDE